MIKRRHISYLLMFFLTACVQPVLDEEKGAPILFGAEAQVESVVVKSTGDTPSTSDSFLSDGSAFGVFGRWINAYQTDSLDTFFKQEVAYSNSSWTYSPLQYWRKSGSYKFSAVYPFSTTCEDGSGPDRLVIKYSMHTGNNDLMAAKKVVSAFSGTGQPDPVTLQFHHACAAVRFLFKNGVDDDNTVTYHLDSFELQRLQTIGIFIFTSIPGEGEVISYDDWFRSSDHARAASVYKWSAESATDRVLIPRDYSSDDSENPGYAQKILEKNDPKLPLWYFVIPQDLTEDDGSGYVPSVQFSVSVNDGVPVTSSLSLIKDILDRPIETTKWLPGYLYTYYIRIQRSQITMTVDVEPWDSYKVVVDDLIFE